MYWRHTWVHRCFAGWFWHVVGLRIEAAEVAIAWNDDRQGTGMLGAISASAPWQVTRGPIPVGTDSVLESAFGKLFVLSTGDGTVRVVDPVSWTVERTYPLAANDEPVDI